MKNQRTTMLFFYKSSLVELNGEELQGVNGGTSILQNSPISCTFCVNSSKGHYIDEFSPMAGPL